MRLTNGPTLTYKFNKNLLEEIQAIQDAMSIRVMVTAPDRATISKIRKLNFRANQIKKTVYYNPKLAKLGYEELLSLLQQKVSSFERGKAISRGKALAKTKHLSGSSQLIVTGA